jgi:CRP-like cAMP-binding protein
MSISKKLKGSSSSAQFIFMSLLGLTGLTFSFMSAFNVKSGYILLVIYTAILLTYSLFNIKHEWGEFLNRKRNSLTVIAIMILITAACMYISKDLQREALNISFNRKQRVDIGIVNDRAFAMYCLIAGALSLILNIPGVIYRKSTQSFAPNFSIVFGSHMILYFLVILAFSKNFLPIIESITACSFLLILGIGAMKTALNSKHYIEPYPLKSHNEKETLSTAFKFILDNMMRSIREDFGEYRCGIISNKFNKHAAKVGWSFTLEEPADDDNINTLGNVYDQSFAVIKKLCEEECGKSYTDEMIIEIDDHFHSTAREIVNSRINSFTHDKEKKTHLNLTKEKKTEIIKDVILFQNIEESDKDQLLDCLHSVSYEVGDLIIKQHDDGDRLFVLAEGKAQVEIEDLAGNSNVVSYLSENEFFGEIALLTSSERTASVRAVEKCTVLYLKKKDFDTFLGLNPEKKEKIMSTLDYLRLIKSIPLFRGISSSVINLFASQMDKEEFKKGDNIINQGDEGDKFYVILDGTVNVHVVRDDNKDHKVATLSKGEYFGEIALFKNIPRTATITVDTDSATVLSLQKEHFVKAIDNQNSLEVNLENVTHRRIVQMMG